MEFEDLSMTGFRLRQKKINYHITLMVTDNSENGYTSLECKDYAKC